MAATRCQICGKGPQFGHQISHAHNVSRRRQYPNVHRMRVLVGNGPRYLYVCTRCLRSGRVQKVS
ncbi:MAG: 50S ribosomal protein L28 [candidate division NC10 bacterium]|nr:50S ribosomal protein L28 [candidate division NC10 bacterium]